MRLAYCQGGRRRAAPEHEDRNVSRCASACSRENPKLPTPYIRGGRSSGRADRTVAAGSHSSGGRHFLSSRSSTGRTTRACQPSRVLPPLEQQSRQRAVLVRGHTAVTQPARWAWARTAKAVSVGAARPQRQSGRELPLTEGSPLWVYSGPLGELSRVPGKCNGGAYWGRAAARRPHTQRTAHPRAPWVGGIRTPGRESIPRLLAQGGFGGRNSDT